jgi:hypothetical protein
MTISEQIQNFALDQDCDIKLIQPYHIRLMKDNYTSVDVFPGSLRMFFLGSKLWVSNETLGEVFIRIKAHFNG